MENKTRETIDLSKIKKLESFELISDNTLHGTILKINGKIVSTVDNFSLTIGAIPKENKMEITYYSKDNGKKFIKHKVVFPICPY